MFNLLQERSEPMRIRGSQGKYETKGPHMVSVTFSRTDLEGLMNIRVSKSLMFLDTEVRAICSELARFATPTSCEIHARVQNATTGQTLLVIRYGDTLGPIKAAENRLAQDLLEECDA